MLLLGVFSGPPCSPSEQNDLLKGTRLLLMDAVAKCSPLNQQINLAALGKKWRYSTQAWQIAMESGII